MSFVGTVYLKTMSTKLINNYNLNDNYLFKNCKKKLIYLRAIHLETNIRQHTQLLYIVAIKNYYIQVALI